MSATNCPDCGGTAEGARIVHEDSCPLFGALERTSADDARWFRDHPGQARRYRRTTAAERSEQRLQRPGVSPDTKVTVSRLDRGVHQHTGWPSGCSTIQVTSAAARTVAPTRATTRGGVAR